jgi:hypothetical protein
MKVTCTQCGGAVKIEGESPFITCNYCQATLFAGMGLSVDTWLVRPLLSMEEGISNVESFLTAKHVDITEVLIHGQQVLIPFAEYEGTSNKVIRPLIMLNVSLNTFKTLKGDKESYSDDTLPQWRHFLPHKKAEETLDWKSQKEGKSFHIVYYPFFIVDYSINNNEFLSLVDAVTGETFADEVPASLPEQGKHLFAVFLFASFVLYLLPLLIYSSSIKFLMVFVFFLILTTTSSLPLMALLYISLIVLTTTGIVS